MGWAILRLDRSNLDELDVAAFVLKAEIDAVLVSVVFDGFRQPRRH
jgi:hypothetical protein